MNVSRINTSYWSCKEPDFLSLWMFLLYSSLFTYLGCQLDSFYMPCTGFITKFHSLSYVNIVISASYNLFFSLNYYYDFNIGLGLTLTLTVIVLTFTLSYIKRFTRAHNRITNAVHKTDMKTRDSMKVTLKGKSKWFRSWRLDNSRHITDKEPEILLAW